jgi:hypothetical protein
MLKTLTTCLSIIFLASLSFLFYSWQAMVKVQQFRWPAGGGYRPRDRFETHIMHACICISICKCILLYMRCPLTFISALLLFERALVLTIVCLLSLGNDV